MATQTTDTSLAVPGDVVKSLLELGVEVIRQVGDEVSIRCPAHLRRTGKIDQHPSCSVNADTGRVNCFSCGFKGPFAAIVREMLGLNNDAVDDWIRERGSIDRAYRLLHEEEHEFVPQVTESDLAFFVGAPEWACRERNINRGCADYMGVLWDSRREHWITPVRDPRSGQLWGWQAKGQNIRYFRNRPVEVPKSQTLFGLHRLEGDTAVLVESPLDTAVLDSAGIDGAVSSFGANVSDAQIQTLVEHGVQTLICALDNDSKGIVNADSLIRRTRGMFRLFFFNYERTSAKDPGDMTYDEIEWAYRNSYSSILWTKS